MIINRLPLFAKTLTALLVIALGLQLAWWTWHFITPSLRGAPIASETVSATDVSLGRQLFGKAGTAAAVSGPATAGGIRLKGVFAVDGVALSAAVLNLGGRDQAVKKGDELSAGVTLAEVHADYVIISRAGVRERIDIDRYDSRAPKSDVAANAPATKFRLNVASTGTNAYSLSRQELNSVLQDPRQQVYFNGRLSAASTGGVRVDDVPAGSLLDKIGLKNGDVITGINGQPVNSQGDLVRLYTQFGTLASIRAEVRRGGAPVVMSYAIQN
ncbi:MAG: type II secretion system protein N [Usitatibacteraceae bacterium]